MALMEPALRTGETEPPDEFQEALKRLSAARDSLARAEGAFMAYCRDLAAFASAYRQHLGDLCEELDRLSAELAAALAKRFSQSETHLPDNSERAHAEHARPAAVVTAVALSLRGLYRIAARRFHPDLARDSTDRDWRATMMRRVNAAFASGDSATLQTLLDQPAAAHPIPTSRLAEIEREIADALARIADLHAAREQMEASDIGQLHAQATGDGQDPICFLRRLAAAVRTEILEKRALLAELTNPEPPP
jgi:DNA repair exonuclease SbcCD ATPase subunit